VGGASIRGTFQGWRTATFFCQIQARSACRQLTHLAPTASSLNCSPNQCTRTHRCPRRYRDMTRGRSSRMFFVDSGRFSPSSSHHRLISDFLIVATPKNHISSILVYHPHRNWNFCRPPPGNPPPGNPPPPWKKWWNPFPPWKWNGGACCCPWSGAIGSSPLSNRARSSDKSSQDRLVNSTPTSTCQPERTHLRCSTLQRLH
jgi:hypothetical protein